MRNSSAHHGGVILATQPNFDSLVTDLEIRIPQLMDEAAVPGLSIALIREGKLFWRKGFGVKNVSTNEAIDNDTIFEAASSA